MSASQSLFNTNSDDDAPPDDDDDFPDDPPPDDDDDLPPDDDDLPPDDEEPQSDDEPPPDDDMGDEDDEPAPDDDEAPPEDDDEPPASDEEDEPPPDDSPPPSDDDEKPVVNAKRPDRRISRHKAESFDMSSRDGDSIMFDESSFLDNVVPVVEPPPVVKRPPPPPPSGPPPPPKQAPLTKSSFGYLESSLVALPPPPPPEPETSLEDDLASLSFGLQVAMPTKLGHSKLKNSGSIRFSLSADMGVGFQKEEKQQHRASLLKAFGDLESTDGNLDTSVTSFTTPEMEALPTANDISEFIMLQGCYEGDSYEPLGVRVAEYGLLVYVPLAGQVVELDLLDAMVEGYLADDVSFTLVKESRKMFFKAARGADRRAFFDSLPSGVVGDADAAASSSRNISALLLASGTAAFDTPQMADLPGAGAGVLSMKDIAKLLNFDSDMINAGSFLDTKDDTVKGHSRVELLESHIRRPHVSVRRAKQICKWITSLHLQTKPIDVQNYHTEFCTGVLLAKLIRLLIPGSEFPNLTERPLARKAALQNIELSLTIIWRTRSVNTSRIATSIEIFQGNKLKIMIMLQEIFDVCLRQSVFSNGIKVMKWYNFIMKQYSRRIPMGVFTESDYSGVWNTFKTGIAIFCVIYHLYGPATIGEGADVVSVDPMRMLNKPKNILEFKSNIIYVFSLLRALKIEVCWDPVDWITFPDVDFVMIQLQYIYEALKNKHTVLTPASGTQAGVTSGSNGEPLVVGVIFGDTTPLTVPVLKAGAEGVVFSKKNVSILMATDLSLGFPPIDSTGKGGRFSSTVCPFGLLGMSMKVMQTPIAVSGKRLADKKSWTISVENSAEQDRALGSRHVEKLKQKNVNLQIAEGSVALHRFVGGAAEGARDVLKEVVVHEYTKEGYKQQVVKLNADGSIPMAAVSSTAGVIEIAMDKLENDLQDAEAGIEAMEDDLAAQYLELEACAHTLGLKEYEKKVADLEKVRLSLEVERGNLHEAFTMRMVSVKSQYTEAVARAGAVVTSPSASTLFKAPSIFSPATPAKPAQSPRKSPGATLRSPSSPSKLNRPSPAVANPKAWVSPSTSSQKTHNIVLKKLVESSTKGKQDTLVPPSVKEKQVLNMSASALASSSTSLASPSRDKIKMHRKNDHVEVFSAEEAWQSFLVNLRVAQDTWSSGAVNPRGVKSREIGVPKSLNSSVAANASSSSTQQPAGVGGNRIAANAVRATEQALMFGEDMRRRIFMKQQASLRRQEDNSENNSSLSPSRKTKGPDSPPKGSDVKLVSGYSTKVVSPSYNKVGSTPRPPC